MGSLVNRFRVLANTTYNGIFPGVNTVENFVVTGTLGVSGTATLDGAVALNGAVTVGNASTDTMTMTGRFIPRHVSDAGPMTATAGALGEIVYNTSNSKGYICTAASESAATWSALN
jgi:hypothetical protein